MKITIALRDAARVIAHDFPTEDHHRVIREVVRYGGVCLQKGSKLQRAADGTFTISGYSPNGSDVDSYIHALGIVPLALQPQPQSQENMRFTISTRYAWGSTAVLMTEDEYYLAFVAQPAPPTAPTPPQAVSEYADSLHEASEMVTGKHAAKSAVVFACQNREASAGTRRFAKRYSNRNERRQVRQYIRSF